MEPQEADMRNVQSAKKLEKQRQFLQPENTDLVAGKSQKRQQLQQKV